MTDGTATDHEGLLDALGLHEAACVTAVTGATEAEAIRLFGGDPDRARARGPAGEPTADLPHDGLPSISVARAGPAVTVVEYGGRQGSREEVLRPLSRLGGRAASACWETGGVPQLALAEGGFLLSAFAMTAPDQRHGARPEAWDPHLSGLAPGRGTGQGAGPGAARGAGLAAVARATGARLDAAWARGTQLVVRIEEVPRAPLPQELEDSPLLAQEPFPGYLARLEPGAAPEMERYAAELAARYNELAGDALCTLALAVLDGCGPPEGRDSLRAELAARAAAARTAGPDGGTERRAAAVWQALGDLLAREAGARVDGPAPMVHLVQAMTPGPERPQTSPASPSSPSSPAPPTPAAPTAAADAGVDAATDAHDRFRLLHALYETATDGTPAGPGASGRVTPGSGATHPHAP